MICLITIHSILIQQIAIIFFIFNLIPRAPGMMNRETMFLSSLPFSMWTFFDNSPCIREHNINLYDMCV